MRFLVVALALVAGCSNDPCNNQAGGCLSVEVDGMSDLSLAQVQLALSGPVVYKTVWAPMDTMLPVLLGVLLPSGSVGIETVSVTVPLVGNKVLMGSDTVLLTGGHDSLTVSVH
jgi:hypothetical protein